MGIYVYCIIEYTYIPTYMYIHTYCVCVCVFGAYLALRKFVLRYSNHNFKLSMQCIIVLMFPGEEREEIDLLRAQIAEMGSLGL